MSKPTWEEEIEVILARIEKKLDALMGQGFETPKPKTTEKKTKSDITNLGDLKVGDKSTKDNKINVEGTLVTKPEQKDVNTSSGPATVTEITLNDGTGEVKISFWDEAGDPLLELNAGDMIRIDNMWRVKDVYKDTLQIDAGQYCKVTTIES